MAKQTHEAHCLICRSRDCKEIEEKYLDWKSPETLETDYPEFKAWSIRNHCKAKGLDVKRNGNLRGVCVAVMERGLTCMKNSPVDAKSVISAAQLHGKLDGVIVDKHEHSGKVKTEIGISEEVKKQVGNILDAIGGVPDDSLSE